MRLAWLIAALVLFITSIALAGEMCSSHGVLAAVCTRCNPKLIPVFKAKNDWCEEHQLPESFCPQCHPERNGAPAGDLEAERAPADGLRIKLASPAVAAMSGIEVEPVREESDQPAVTGFVRLSWDPSRVAVVNPRSAGVIRSLEATTGDRVDQGAILASIESAVVGQDRSRLESAGTRLRVARAGLDRQRKLLQTGVGIPREILASEQEVASAQAEVDAVRAALKITGESSVDGLSSLRSPITGIVTRRTASLSQMVDSEHELFEIVDGSELIAEIEIQETDVTRVQTCQMVEIRFPGLSDRSFTGKLASLSPSIDPRTRTVTGRLTLPNPDGSLRANMYGEARIFVGSSRRSFLLPRPALQRVEDVWLAFVRIAPDEYETRRLTLGETGPDRVHVLTGLEAGEEVVTTGSFLMKTETLKGSIGAGCCEVEGKK